MFLPCFNFLEDTSSKIGHKVAKTCSCENFFHRNMTVFIIYIYNRYLTNDMQLMLKERE